MFSDCCNVDLALRMVVVDVVVVLLEEVMMAVCGRGGTRVG